MASCMLCGSKNWETVLKTKDNDPREIKTSKIFNLVRCKNCGLHFVSNMPSQKEIGIYYNTGYYAKKDAGNGMINRLVMLSRLSKTTLAKESPKKSGVFGALETRVSSRVDEKKLMESGSFDETFLKSFKGSVLDYGCGNGDFLLKMKQAGFDANGVEFSDAGKKMASKKIGKKILDENEFYRLNKRFDLITMWHVLEHIAKPDKMLKQFHKILKNDGLLLISVPNIAAFQFYLFKRNTFHLDIPRHGVHYSPKSIKKLLEKNGFNVLRFNHYSFEYNPFGFVQSCLNSIGCEFNFLYNAIKRGYKRRVSTPKFIYSFFATFILLPFLVLIALPITYAESFFRHGASFVVYAKKI